MEQITEPQIIDTNYPITAIILAAGLSRRMGKPNKLLLKIGTQSLIEKVVDTVLQSKVEEIIVVLGHEATKIQRILRGKEVKLTKNPLYQLGMTTSIQAGVQVASMKSKGYMIVLGDLAQIQASELNLLIEGFENSLEETTKSENIEQEEQAIEVSIQTHVSPTPIVVPLFEGKRGNPVIFSQHFRAAILQHTNSNGCKSIIEANTNCVVAIEMSNNHVLKDIDTPSDYDDFINKK